VTLGVQRIVEWRLQLTLSIQRKLQWVCAVNVGVQWILQWRCAVTLSIQRMIQWLCALCVGVQRMVHDSVLWLSVYSEMYSDYLLWLSVYSEWYSDGVLWLIVYSDWYSELFCDCLFSAIGIVTVWCDFRCELSETADLTLRKVDNYFQTVWCEIVMKCINSLSSDTSSKLVRYNTSLSHLTLQRTAVIKHYVPAL